MTFIVGPVTLYGFEDGRDTVLAQYDPSDRWNGWLCPSMDAHSAVAILDMFNTDAQSDPGLADSYIGYTFEDETLVLHHALYPDDPPERITPDEDGLYSLGAYAWTWAENAHREDTDR